MPLTLNVVTAERTVLQRDDVLRLIVPTTEGQITVLPSHAALMSSLGYGELLAVVPGGETIEMTVFSGFIQVVHDHVTVLADAAERAEDINEDRADAARARAQEHLAGDLPPDLDLMQVRLALSRALIRLRVRRRARNVSGVRSMSER